MKFERGTAKKYRKSVEDAFAVIAEFGNEFHRHMVHEMVESKMLIRCQPVAEINASGITGVIDSARTNEKIAAGPMSLREALGEVYIAIANETMNTQRGCEGTFVHEGRHAYDFAQTIASLSNAAVNPLSIFDPSLYEMERLAHKAAGEYMLCIDKQEYLDEGLQLMILCSTESGKCEVSEDGIRRRLNESYGMQADGNVGPLASQMLGLRA